MTLKERIAGVERVYPDDQKLSLSRLSKILKVKKHDLTEAALQSGAEIEDVPTRKNTQETSIREIPKLVSALAQVKTPSRQTPRYEKLQGLDTSQDFKIEFKASTLRYEHPKNKK